MIYFLGSYLWNLLNLFLFIFYLRENLRLRFVYIFVRHYMNPDGLWIWSWHRPIRIQALWDSRFLLAPMRSICQRDTRTNIPIHWPIRIQVPWTLDNHWLAFGLIAFSMEHYFTDFEHFKHSFLLLLFKNPSYFTISDVLLTFYWHFVFYFTRYGRVLRRC